MIVNKKLNVIQIPNNHADIVLNIPKNIFIPIF